ncbi:MAG: OadG family protein [Lacrimispora sp.]|uniref:OadG family protein n=1 Tax=Lacrimispora sp. TaxID=2719234 RepID=UPI0039E69EA4
MDQILDITFRLRDLIVPCVIIIAVFVFLIGKLMAKKQENEKDFAAESMPAVTATEPSCSSIDREVVAVITAAIYEVMGKENRGLTVRGIRRIPKAGK